MKKRIWLSVFIILTALIVFISLFPLVWMFLSGFKSKTEVVAVPFRFLPKVFDLSNYEKILIDPRFPRAMIITFLGALVSVMCTLVVNTCAAYGFARIDFPGKRLFWAYCLLPMFIPGIAILIPSFLVVHTLGMLNTYAVLIIPGVAQAGHVFFLRQYFLSLPLSLEEASFIDGCSRFGTLARVFVPMSFPPLVIVGMGAFLGYWNSFIWPVLTLSDEKLYQIMQFLAFFRSERDMHLGIIMAGALLTSIPPLILMFVFQKYIVQGIKIAGLK